MSRAFLAGTLELEQGDCGERRCLRPAAAPGTQGPSSQPGPGLARLPGTAAAAGTHWPRWTAAPQGPSQQGMALGRVPGQERAPEHVCLSRAISALLFLLPALLCPWLVLLGLLLARQPPWEPALAAARAGSPGQGPAIKRPIKALDSSRTLSRGFWTTIASLQLHSSLPGNVSCQQAAFKGSWGMEINNLLFLALPPPEPDIAQDDGKWHSDQRHYCAYHAGLAHILGAENSRAARRVLGICV